MGESEGDLGESGKSSVGVFLGCCGRGISWAGLSGLAGDFVVVSSHLD